MSETLMTSLAARALGWALLQSLWQGVVIGGISAVTLLALRRGTASRRYLVACAGMLAIPVAFAVTAIDALDRVAPPSASRSTAAHAAPAVARVTPATATGAEEILPGEPQPLPPPSLSERLQEWSAALVPVWLLGVALLSVRFAMAWTIAERIRRASDLPAPDWCRSRLDAMCRQLGVLRGVAIVQSARVTVPTMIGWLRPVILLPLGVLTGLSAEQLEAVIAHEVAHVRRHDYLVNVLQSAIEILFFYHPATWWISRQIRIEREHCCDDIAVSLCGNRLTYARALVDLAALHVSSVAPGLAATDGPLTTRIRRLLGVTGRDRLTPGGPAALGLALVCVLLVGGWGISRLAAQSATPGAGRNIPSTEGVIAGAVVDGSSGEPVAGARVSLFKDGRNAKDVEAMVIVKTATADGDGRFEITAVPPGDYVMIANAAGFVETSYGDMSRSGAGTSVRAAGGRLTSNVEFRLQRSGSLSGTIFADSGEGLPGVEVEVLRNTYKADGPPMAVGFAQTEEGGAFRVRGLQPGEYYVRAYVGDAIRPTRGDKDAAYASTFFPDVTRVEDAQRVLIQGGEERFGVDFSLATARKLSLSGKVIDPGGRPVAGVRIRLHSLDSGGGPDNEGADMTVAADGRFTIRGLTPGRYMLMAGDNRDYRRWLGVSRMIDVTEDVTGLEIYAEQPTHIEARFARDGGGALPFDPREITVTIEQRMAGATGPTFMSGIGPGRHIDRDGTFAIDAGSGTAYVQVRDLPPRWIVKSIALDGVDVTDQPMELGAGARRRLEISLSDRVSSVTGTVTDTKNRPVSSAVVLLFPEDRARWQSTRAIKSAAARMRGSFHIEDLPAGEYRVVAIGELPMLAARDPEVFDRLWPVSTPLRLNEGEQRTLALKLAPARVTEP